jgi:hypothetical protein
MTILGTLVLILILCMWVFGVVATIRRMLSDGMDIKLSTLLGVLVIVWIAGLVVWLDGNINLSRLNFTIIRAKRD